ncbi:MAG: hypothetical protein LBR15_06310 [Methanobrevibacter sp.]|jgi:type I restriction enzyme S subunit|nr:hypothetical protein [Candidatus Methanovirga australis]
MGCVPELRFKDENGNSYPDLETISLGKITEIKKGFTPSTTDSTNWDGGLSLLSIADMKEGKYLYNTNKTISEKVAKNSSLKNPCDNNCYVEKNILMENW